MELNLRKLWSVLGVTCLSINLSAAVATNQSGTQISKPAPSACLDATCYAGPVLNHDSAGIDIGADFILWSARQEGLEYIASNYSTNTSQTEPNYAYGPRFNLRPGFKVRAGVTIADADNMDIQLQYTWLDRSTGNTSAETLDDTFATISVNPVAGSAPTQVIAAYSTWKLDYNVVDLEMGRMSSLAKDSLNFRPFWGLRGIWQTQSYTATYFEYQTPTTQQNIYVKQKTSGVGIRTGLNYVWNFFANDGYKGGFSIVGASSVSGVYGSTSLEQQFYSVVDATTPTTAATTYYVNCKNSMQRIIPVIDLSLGITWDIMFGGDTDDEYALEFRALWDTQSWIGMGKQFSGTTQDRGPQNLTLQGLTVGLGFWF